MNATRRLVTLAVLVVLLAATAAGLVLTRRQAPRDGAAAPAGATGAAGRAAGPGAAPGSAPAASPGAPPARRRWVVDMKPLLAARALAAYASTPEEAELARHAERLADHAIDLAFVVAMRDATEGAPPETPELRALGAARASAQAGADAAQARVRELEAKLAGAPERARPELQDRLEVARAELELARDELASAAEALARAGGDPQAHVRRLREVYDAAQKEPRPAQQRAPEAGPASSVLDRLRAWSWHRDVRARLGEARRDIAERSGRLDARRADLAKRGEPDPRRLAAIDGRLRDLRELEETYGAWAAEVDGHVRGSANRLLWGVLALLVLLALGFAAGEVAERLFRGVGRDKVRVHTLRTVVRVAVNLVTLLLAVAVVFGMPAQTTTLIGLAGAGLTVALKDFIVAFFGWFILMGRNGIRVGDWVEVKGVGGEVVEIGLFHTVLLETGSWSDAGHPTGRRVSFVNSFAIEGHYFNFSTSGQWMWDELRLLIPPGRDPYPVIDGVQRLVEEETAANAKAAEGEWRSSTSKYRVQTFSAVPGLHVVPTTNGMEVVVRYITRAHERHESRRRLYQAVLELLHGKRAAGAIEAGEPGAAAVTARVGTGGA